MRCLIQGAGIALIVGAVLAAAAGCVPFEWLRPLGSLIRRPDDVTPERYARYLQVCWAFAAAFAIGGICLRRWPATIALAVERWLADWQSLAPASRQFPNCWAFPLAILGVGVAVRLWRLDGPIAYDEAYTFLNFARRPWYEAIADYNSPNNHALNTFLMHWCYRVWGQEEWALRLPVFVAGVGLLPLVYGWSKELLGPAAALVATSLTAVAPALVTYSADARGYSLVVFFAVLLDLCLGRIHEGGSRPRLYWTFAWMAVVLGLFSMPTMLYPIVGILGWFSVARMRGEKQSAKLAELLVFAGTAGFAVAALYAPAYIFRGLMFLQDPVMDPGPAGYWGQVGPGWRAAFDWWTAGSLPGVLWGVAIAAGAVALLRTPARLGRVMAPFLAMFFVSMLLQASPPARVYLYLAPWVYLVAADGLRTAVASVTSSLHPLSIAAGAVLVAGAWFGLSRSVLIDPRDRLVYVSVEDVIAHLDAEGDGGSQPKWRLLAPLPADLPSLFYMERMGFQVPVNGEPQPGERLWLIARRGESPEATLADDLVQLDEWIGRVPWKEVKRLETLTLYRADVPNGATFESGER